MEISQPYLGEPPYHVDRPLTWDQLYSITALVSSYLHGMMCFASFSERFLCPFRVKGRVLEGLNGKGSSSRQDKILGKARRALDRLGPGDGSRLEPKGASPYVGSFLKQKPVRFWFSPVLPDTIHL